MQRRSKTEPRETCYRRPVRSRKRFVTPINSQYVCHAKPLRSYFPTHQGGLLCCLPAPARVWQRLYPHFWGVTVVQTARLVLARTTPSGGDSDPLTCVVVCRTSRLRPVTVPHGPSAQRYCMGFAPYLIFARQSSAFTRSESLAAERSTSTVRLYLLYLTKHERCCCHHFPGLAHGAIFTVSLLAAYTSFVCVVDRRCCCHTASRHA